MEPALQVSNIGGGLVSSVPTAQGSQFTSGRYNPDVPNRVQAIMINPFVKWKGLEFFGSYEIVSGSNYADVSGPADRKVWEKRNFTQYSAELAYRFFQREQVYVAARYIGLTAEPRGMLDADGNQLEVSIDRVAVAAGWFPTKNMLLKGECVLQNYKDFRQRIIAMQVSSAGLRFRQLSVSNFLMIMEHG